MKCLRNCFVRVFTVTTSCSVQRLDERDGCAKSRVESIHKSSLFAEWAVIQLFMRRQRQQCSTSCVLTRTIHGLIAPNSKQSPTSDKNPSDKSLLCGYSPLTSNYNAVSCNINWQLTVGLVDFEQSKWYWECKTATALIIIKAAQLKQFPISWPPQKHLQHRRGTKVITKCHRSALRKYQKS